VVVERAAEETLCLGGFVVERLSLLFSLVVWGLHLTGRTKIAGRLEFLKVIATQLVLCRSYCHLLCM
jgi:hypothetical protein